MAVHRYFVTPALPNSHVIALASKLGSKFDILSFNVECCYYVTLRADSSINDEDKRKVIWLLKKPDRQTSMVSEETFFGNILAEDNAAVLEFGPRLTFTSAFSTNAVSACHSAGLTMVVRLERSFRYIFRTPTRMSEYERRQIGDLLHDRMTECEYVTPPTTFDLEIPRRLPYEIDVIGCGIPALREANKSMGLSFDEADMAYYLKLFCDVIKRNPTNVELFDLAQSNSEHSRHWFFKGHLIVDGKEVPSSLFQMVSDTQKYSNANNVIKFCDNSSAIVGFTADILQTERPYENSLYQLWKNCRHIIYTAETHNFPTAVCPFPGAATGTGGRIRDVQGAGRGGHVVAGTAGYCFGNLLIPGYKLPWEDSNAEYSKSFASPLDICIQASNGASDYGNKFGEPVICGFARSFGQNLVSGERVEYVKPIMFSGGIGTIDDHALHKLEPKKDMLVVKIGGPAYRIGVGGGSASSVEIQGEQNRKEELDFGAVQRGDAEMEQKLNRVIRGCVELGNRNPIASIHDQGAGGNGNVLKEIVEGAGAIIDADAFELGDKSMSILELWGAEYQESNAILIQPNDKQMLQDICRRERCPCSIVGRVTDDNKIILTDFHDAAGDNNKRNPVELPLDDVLQSVPRKTFELETVREKKTALHLPKSLTVNEALDRVLRLPSVASKRYLTNKVDRSVTGLIAQQQCVGPLHTPVADVSVIAVSYFDTVGGALAIGEQPIKMLVDPASGARMTVGESLTNLVFAPITCLRDVKCSANWMWPAKLKGEGAKLLSACRAMCDVMNELGIAVDGGKDSLSMAAQVEQEIVKSPGTLVISAYAPCIDITRIVTPDLKCPDGRGTLLYIRFGCKEQNRLGGSALAQCYEQIGDQSPDLSNAVQFREAFDITQSLIITSFISAGHDVSDGGLITTVLEMAFAGNCSVSVDLNISEFADASPIDILFAEELGIVLEVKSDNVNAVIQKYHERAVPCWVIGYSEEVLGPNAKVKFTVSGNVVLEEFMCELRLKWEATSLALEKHQCNPKCVEEETKLFETFVNAPYELTEAFRNSTVKPSSGLQDFQPAVIVLREEGSNGDREMAAAFMMAGFRVWDFCMEDLLQKDINLNSFQGLAFVGGFSYGDVLGSAKGWASKIAFNRKLQAKFEYFYGRDDTFSFGVCNGCQLMCLLGLAGVPFNGDYANLETYLDHNESGRYESRFCAVRIEPSPSIMLKDMQRCTLGVWVGHGEGKFVIRSGATRRLMESNDLIPIVYVDSNGLPTESYPSNPNGSPKGYAGICSMDGRHLAMMPHPERSFLSWQWPYWPKNWERAVESRYVSPWFKMFQNAFIWCQEVRNSDKIYDHDLESACSNCEVITDTLDTNGFVFTKLTH